LSLAEDGEAFWNDQWLLELTKEKEIMSNKEQWQTEEAPVELKISRVYQILTIESEKKQMNYGVWELTGWDCREEQCLFFVNRHGGELRVPMQDTETGAPKEPWVVLPVNSCQ
jgi:hypothetical protein